MINLIIYIIIKHQWWRRKVQVVPNVITDNPLGYVNIHNMFHENVPSCQSSKMSHENVQSVKCF